MTTKNDYHQSVLLKKAVENLVTDCSGFYFDGTLGGGGHTREILSRLNSKGRLLSVDRDFEAIQRAKKLFENEKRLSIKHSCFSKLEDLVEDESLQGVLLDLGVSSYQFDQPHRGFSFEYDYSPLDMRMNQHVGNTAVDFINNHTPREIAHVFFVNSDIIYSIGNKVAKILKEKINDNQTVSVIKEVLKELYPLGIYNQSKLLAQIFQAIRIEVNQEKNEVREVLRATLNKLVVGGIVCVISFHSVEDRWVKQFFKRHELNCICPIELPMCQCGGNQKRFEKLVKKPMIPSLKEIQENSRSRSAKLRVLQKIK